MPVSDETLDEVERALEPFASLADGRRSKGVFGSMCFSQDYLLIARAALYRLRKERRE